ncbi:MAG: hypothetical protein N4A54_10210 [Peptostreptococcaceae bacterium]|nr:hypothetical protein [Peptostreptococcaceae bacterium]
MENNDNKIMMVIILNVTMFCLIMAASLNIYLNSLGKETVIGKFKDVGIMTDYEQIERQRAMIFKEVDNLPIYNPLSNKDFDALMTLGHEDRVMYYNLKKIDKFNNEEILALIDLGKNYNIDMSVFLVALSLNDDSLKNNDIFENDSIKELLGREYKESEYLILNQKKPDYKNLYVKGMYFNYLYEEYKKENNIEEDPIIISRRVNSANIDIVKNFLALDNFVVSNYERLISTYEDAEVLRIMNKNLYVNY